MSEQLRACTSSEGYSANRNYSLDINVIVGKGGRLLDRDGNTLFLGRENQIAELKWLIKDRQANWGHDKNKNPLFVVSNSPGQGKSVFLAFSGQELTQEGDVLSGAAVLPFTYNSGMTEEFTGVGIKAAVMLRAIYGGLMSSQSPECGGGVSWEDFVAAFDKVKQKLGISETKLGSVHLCEWLQAAREMMGLPQTASKHSQLLLLVDEVMKVKPGEADATSVFTILGEVLDASCFNNVLVSSLAPNYARDRLTKSQRTIRVLIMTTIDLSNSTTRDKIFDVASFRSNFSLDSAVNVRLQRRRVFDIALDLSGGHPRSIQKIIDKFGNEETLWEKDGWKELLDIIPAFLSKESTARFAMPSLLLLEKIVTRGKVPVSDSDFTVLVGERGLTASEAVEYGCLHIAPDGDHGNQIVVDLLPFQMREAILLFHAPMELSAVADWTNKWSTARLQKPLTAFEYLFLLFRAFLDVEEGQKYVFQASDGAELCAAFSVISAIQKGKANIVLGSGAAGNHVNTDVVLESYQIRPCPQRKEDQEQLRSDFLNRVQHLKQPDSNSGRWAVLMPPLGWRDADVYVVSPGGRVTAISVKSYATNPVEQLQKLNPSAHNAKDSNGLSGLVADSFVAWLGYGFDDARKVQQDDIDFVVTSSDLCRFVPLSVISLSMLSITS